MLPEGFGAVMYVLDLTMLTLLLMALLVATVYVIPAKTISGHREAISVGVFAVLLSTLLIILFFVTPFGLGSYLGDQQYILAAIEKYTISWSWVDFSYAHMATYYPPLYFYVLGKAAWLLHLPPYSMAKSGFVVTAVVLPPVVYRVWTPLVGKRPAMLLVILFFLAFPSEFMYKTYEFLTAALVLPWWLYFGERLRQDSATSKRSKVTSLLVGGLLGSLIFQTYYYWFFVIACYLVVSPLLNVGFKDQTWRQAVSDFWHKVKLLLVVAVFSAYYWVPLLIQVVTIGYQNFQNRWLSQSMMKINVFQLLDQPNFLGLVLLAGLVYLLFTYKRSRLHQVLMNLTVACFIWYLIGFVGILFGMPNLHIKAWMFNDYLLLVGAVIAVTDLTQIRYLRAFANRTWAFAACLVILVLGQSYVSQTVGSSLYKDSIQYDTPPVAIDQLNAAKPLQGKVFLTNEYSAIDFVPVYLFIGDNPNYANPVARYADRYQMLQHMQDLKDMQAFAWLLTYNQFDRVTDVWMTKPDLLVGLDNYPYGTRYVYVSLPMGYTQSPDFAELGSTSIYQVKPVSEQSYKQFGLYALALASTYAKPSLRTPIDTLFLQEVKTTYNPSDLKATLSVVAGNHTLQRAVEQQLTRV